MTAITSPSATDTKGTMMTQPRVFRRVVSISSLVNTVT